MRIFGKILLGIGGFILLLLLFIRSPWGQGIIKDQLISSLSETTGTEIAVERLFITFSGNVYLEGVYLEDQQGDTLVYSRELEADVPIWPLISGGGIRVNSLDWQGVRANIIREDSINGYNFSFLAEAFAPADTTAAQDTTSGSMDIQLGDISLSDFEVVFNDAVLGIESRYELGELQLEMEEMDLEQMRFHASSGGISNTRIDFRQVPVPERPDSEEEATLPFLRLDELTLEKVSADYESVPAGMRAELRISEFLLGLPAADLAENSIEISELQLRDSDVLLRMASAMDGPEEEGQESGVEPAGADPEGFQWPEWNFMLADIDLQNNSFTYLTGEAEPENGVFDLEAVALREFGFRANNLFLRDQEAGFSIDQLTFRESSGLNLKDLSLEGGIDNDGLRLQDLRLALNENLLEGELRLTYDSMDALMEQPEQSSVMASLDQFRLNLGDLFRFQPSLRENPYLLSLSEKPLHGNLRAEGSLGRLQIRQARVNWGGGTSIAAQGTLANLTDPDNLYFDLPQVRLNSRRGDLREIVDEEQMNVRLPEELTLTAAVEGSPEAVEAVADLSSSSGDIALEGNFSSEGEISFDADMQLVELNLGELLMNDQLGTLSMELRASGAGETLNELDADLEANIERFAFNEYPITGLNITGEIRDGSGPIAMDYKDDNLDVAMESMVFLDSVAPQVNMNLDLAGANLRALGLTQRNIRVGLDLDASFRGNMESYDINAEIEDGIAVYDQESYLLGDFGISARVRPDSTAMDVSNQMLQVRLRSDTDPASFASALERHYRSYLSAETEMDTLENPVNLQLEAEIRQNPILDEIFLTGLEEMDTISISVDFDEQKRDLRGLVMIPYVNYSGNEIDSLSIDIDSDREHLEFALGFEALNAGPIAIHRTAFEGEVADEILHLDLNSYYEEEHLVRIRSELRQSNDTLVLWLDPSEVILNSRLWEVPENNEIRMAENSLVFNDFRLTRNEQQLEITDELEGMESEHVAISFENFNLASILSFLNPEETLASGRIVGDFVIEEPYGATGLLAGLSINELNVMRVPLGNLRLDAEAINNQDYRFDLAIKEGNADLDLTGTFEATEEGPQWDTELRLNQIQMAVVEGFSMGEIAATEGSFSGNVELSGSFAEPEYEGYLNFSEAGFTVSMLDAPFTLPDETLRLDDEGVYFDGFGLEDQDNNSFLVNGEILTESLLNPEFDLQLEATDFMLMNSTEEDNDLYYGKAVFDLEAEVTGTLNIPRLRLRLDVDSETDLTYIIPESEVAIESREGVVMFVNKENPDDILTATEEESYTLSGMEVSALLSVEDGATFNIIIDEQTGDNFQVTGTGDLNFNIHSNGRTTLSGRYEMSGGHYEMSLYNLVNRRFEIVEGSSITWAGDPLDANLDLRARYSVETSASDLMAAQVSGAETSVRNQFRQELNFQVYLNIEGELMQPVLTFGLDMPEEEQGAIGGQVYGRVQQINQQEQELNKQVFSLLVLNRFYPESGSDGSSGGAMALARDNINSALSDQLNVISNNLLGDSGFELDFGLDSYTDYQGESPEERTQLDITAERSFMDDRLVVRVGSEVDVQGGDRAPGESTPLIGNVSIDYLITPEGKWRLRGFRRNSYENVIEGQVIVSGLALIFTREFNEFRELWDNLLGEVEQTEGGE